LLVEKVPSFDYSLENTYKMNKLVEKHINKISPAYFSKICATTGLLIFLIKDALEYCGIFQDKKINACRIYQNLNYSINYLDEKITHCNNLINACGFIN
jgi:hypothetical protein